LTARRGFVEEAGLAKKAEGLTLVKAGSAACAEHGAMSDTADLIARYDGRAPRYTSYPTAPHFSGAAGRRASP
jgi:hypothetical protein